MARQLDFLVCVAVLFSLGAVAPENAAFRRLSVEDGLSGSSVLLMHQDRDGYLWVGTQAGLNRFDGYEFEVFELDPADSTTISANYIDGLWEDASGDVWVALAAGGIERFDSATRGFESFARSWLVQSVCEADDARWLGTLDGICRMDRETGEFRHYLGPAADPDSAILVTSLTLDHRGSVWACTSGGIFRYDAAQDEFVSYAADLGADAMSFVMAGARGQLWAGRIDGMIWEYDAARDAWTHRLSLPDALSVFNAYSSWAPFVMEDHEGSLWILTAAGRAMRWHPASGRLTEPLTGALDEQVLVSTLMQDRDGDIWLGTQGQGLLQLELDTTRVYRYEHGRNRPHSLSGSVVMHIYQDRSGLLWVGTLNHGLSSLDLRKRELVPLQHDPNEPTSLIPGGIRSVIEGPDGDIWVGGDGGGIGRLMPPNQTVERLTLGRGHGQLPSVRVSALHIDESRMLWVGTVDQGIWRAQLPPPDLPTDISRLEFGPWTASTLSLPPRVNVFAAGGEGELWIGTARQGLLQVDLLTGQAVPHVADRADPTRLMVNSVWSLLYDRGGSLWVGGPVSGLCRLDPVSGRVHRYIPDSSIPGSLNNKTINSLFEDGQGRVWVGTYSGGLSLFDPQTHLFRAYTRRHGLPSNMINGIAEDYSGHLWLATDKGLGRFDPKTTRCQVFDHRDGLLGLQFSRNSTLLDRTGALVTAGVHGLHRINPDELRDNRHVPSVVLRRVRVFDRELPLEGSGRSPRPLHLGHRENYLTLEFASLDFTNPSANRYRYKLAGVDAGWIDPGSQRQVSYSDLAPGRYEFQVRASNNDGVWNDEGVSLMILIAPPFWMTTWFRGLVGLLFLLVVVVAYHWRVRRLEIDRRRLARRVEENTRDLLAANEELRGLHQQKDEFVRIAAHDMRTPLTTVQGYVGLVLENLQSSHHDAAVAVADLRQVQSGVSRVSRLLTTMLDTAAIEAGQMRLDLESGSITALLEERRRFFRRVAEKKGIELTFAGSYQCSDVLMDRPRMVEVLDNLLSNAVKYTQPGGRVILRYQQLDGEAVVSVEDTGPGLTESEIQQLFQPFRRLGPRPTGGEPSSGLGLAIVKKLVELHGGRVFVSSDPGVGSVFSVALPISEARGPRIQPEATAAV